ncbi:helix-turn-helix transcriptional regulator [bacterium]|nr:helix-turn-helix transcriptional regulator [bacterium]
MIDIGSKIKELRKQKHLTQEQLAKRLWVTKAIISAYENGTRFPSLEILIHLSYVFNVSTDYLLGVSKKQYLDVTELTGSQIALLNDLISEFKN